MEQGANRAAGVGLAVSDDRRGGLMNVGRAATSLADSYRTIGLADVAQREQNAQMVLGEMSNRGTSSYNEMQNLYGYDLANARSLRQEAIQKQQAGMQEFSSTIDQGVNVALAGASMMTGGMGGGVGMGGGQQMSQSAPTAPPVQSYIVDPMYSNQPINLGTAYNGTPTNIPTPSYWGGGY